MVIYFPWGQLHADALLVDDFDILIVEDITPQGNFDSSLEKKKKLPKIKDTSVPALPSGEVLNGNELAEELAKDLDPDAEALTYTARNGETLMLIAFKIYGDYRMWKHLRLMNPRYQMWGRVKAGMRLKYLPPKRPYQRPTGRPYLVKSGEYLGMISQKLYGTSKKWKDLWRQNKRQVRYPDLIFSGFTLFYEPPEDGEEVVRQITAGVQKGPLEPTFDEPKIVTLDEEEADSFDPLNPP